MHVMCPVTPETAPLCDTQPREGTVGAPGNWKRVHLCSSSCSAQVLPHCSFSGTLSPGLLGSLSCSCTCRCQSPSLPAPLQCPPGSPRGLTVLFGPVTQDWAREAISPEPGQAGQWDPPKQTLFWTIPGLLLAWPISMSRCCGRQPGRRCSSLTMRRSGNWASAS